MKTRYKILVIILISIVSVILISTSGVFTPLYSDVSECWYFDGDDRNKRGCLVIDGWFDALLYQISENPRTIQTVISLHDIAEIKSYKGKDCNKLGFPDVNCFIDSFSRCINAKIEDTHGTIEGDPVTMIAMIKNKDGVCTIDVFEDTTKDRFSDQKITKYSCSGIKLDETYLNIQPCTKDSDENVYGFLIQKPV